MGAWFWAAVTYWFGSRIWWLLGLIAGFGTLLCVAACQVAAEQE